MNDLLTSNNNKRLLETTSSRKNHQTMFRKLNQKKLKGARRIRGRTCLVKISCGVDNQEKIYQE